MKPKDPTILVHLTLELPSKFAVVGATSAMALHPMSYATNRVCHEVHESVWMFGLEILFHAA